MGLQHTDGIEWVWRDEHARIGLPVGERVDVASSRQRRCIGKQTHGLVLVILGDEKASPRPRRCAVLLRTGRPSSQGRRQEPSRPPCREYLQGLARHLERSCQIRCRDDVQRSSIKSSSPASSPGSAMQVVVSIAREDTARVLRIEKRTEHCVLSCSMLSRRSKKKKAQLWYQNVSQLAVCVPAGRAEDQY